MSTTAITKIEIRESDLQLVVSEKTLGSLTTNAKQIREIVKGGLARYDIANYDESNIDLAKKDKATLNNAAKLLNAKRLEIEREFMLPFSEFKEVIADTVKLIGDCSANIDIVVKKSEEKAKEQKKAVIQRYFESKEFTLVPFGKLFDLRWLNKTVKEKEIYAEIDGKIAKINDDITTLEAIGEDAELLKSLYLDTLNINSTIQYANTLKQNRERAAAAAAAEKAKREAIHAVQQEQCRPQSNIKPAHVPTPTTHSGGLFPSRDASSPSNNQNEPEPPKEPLLTRALKVTTTRANIIALGDFMNEKGIDFEKIEL
jgi:hypothetical protein